MFVFVDYLTDKRQGVRREGVRHTKYDGRCPIQWTQSTDDQRLIVSNTPPFSLESQEGTGEDTQTKRGEDVENVSSGGDQRPLWV